MGRRAKKKLHKVDVVTQTDSYSIDYEMKQHERRLLNTEATLKKMDSNEISGRAAKVEVETRKNKKVEKVEAKSNTEDTILQSVQLKGNQDGGSDNNKVISPQFCDKTLSLTKKGLKSEEEKLGSITMKRNRQQSTSSEPKQQQQYSSSSSSSSVNKQHCWSNVENRKQERNNSSVTDDKQQKEGNGNSSSSQQQQQQQQGNSSSFQKQQNSESKQHVRPPQRGRQLERQHSLFREQQHQQQQQHHHQQQQHQQQQTQHQQHQQNQSVRDARKGSTIEGTKGHPGPNPKVLAAQLIDRLENHRKVQLRREHNFEISINETG